LVGPPDVDPDGAAVREQLGRGKQHRAASAAHVEQRLVAAQPQALEDVRPYLELADAGGANEQRRGRGQGRAGAAGHRRGDRFASHKTSRRRSEQPHTNCRGNAGKRGCGYRAIVTVVPVVGLVLANVYSSHLSKVDRRYRRWGATSFALSGL